MIVKLLFELIIMLLEILFGWVSFPPMPNAVVHSLNEMLGYMEQAMALVWLVVPRGIVLVCLPIILVIDNFDKIYSVIMWLIKKIPMLGMS